MHWKCSMIAGAAAALLCAAPVQAGTILNGSFEDIVTDWAAIPALVQTPGEFEHKDKNGVPDRTYKPVDGFMLGVIQAGPSTTPNTISQTFTTIGGWFSGSAAFLAEDLAKYNDYGFVRLHKDGDVIELFYRDIVGVGSYGYTPWTKFVTFLDAGTYTLEAGVANSDAFNPSFLLVDNFRLGEVPEPGAWALMLTGFLGLGAALRRRRAAAAS